MTHTYAPIEPQTADVVDPHNQAAGQRPRLSVVVPAYNEAATIAEVIRRVHEVSIEKEIIVVDDGSTDGTEQILQRVAEQNDSDSKSNACLFSSGLRIFSQGRNRGKGAALRRGFQEARGKIVIIQDADLELDPKEYGKLIEPIEQGQADVVYGSRFLGRSGLDIPFLYLVANKVLTLTSNVLTGLRLTDVWTGYKVFRRDVLQKIDLQEDRFGFEPEITAKIAKAGCRVCELPVAYSCRSRAEGKKIGWKDAVRGMWCTIRYSLFS
jgi:glycosyltransferase involved in cell wall biosynthesis